MDNIVRARFMGTESSCKYAVGAKFCKSLFGEGKSDARNCIHL